ncbi:M91 family zinc metallopeptidase [Sphingobacterium sp. MYb382]|uniref:M91 family zinc metallopeptidase n=1 Tax=Sphingobacterium sp. MYb382 TaxID=2745278 RepID=UPI0030A01036
MTSTNNIEIASRSRNSADENGTYILGNPTDISGATDQNGSNQRPSYIGIGDEMAHIQDFWNGTFNSKTWSTFSLPGDGTLKNIKRADIYATHIENRIRAENGLPLRFSSGIDTAGKANISTRIIKSGTNQRLYFNNDGVTNYERLGRKVSSFTS